MLWCRGGDVDFTNVLSDQDLREELISRMPDLAARAGGQMEGLEGGVATSLLTDGVAQLAEGVSGELGATGLEAIVERFTRPVFLVQNGTYTPPKDSVGESEIILALLAGAMARVKSAIPSVGRIDLRNHRLAWVGTGWLVAPNLAVTNRHVAQEFAAEKDGGFAFRAASGGREVKASVDWCSEYQRPAESVVKVDEVLWIEPDGGFDVALLHVLDKDEDGAATPPPIPLMSQQEIADTLSDWVAVIGYPAQSPYNNLEDQQRIFDGIYGVKRLAPGTIMSIVGDGTFAHNATTLGGNSGSVVFHLDTGKAMGLHFGGIEGESNQAVQATVIAELIEQHA